MNITFTEADLLGSFNLIQDCPIYRALTRLNYQVGMVGEKFVHTLDNKMIPIKKSTISDIDLARLQISRGEHPYFEIGDEIANYNLLNMHIQDEVLEN